MVKIKNVITAIGNPMLNNELKNEEINILCGDILYKEGIIEYLEKNINADFIVLNDELPGSIDTEELIHIASGEFVTTRILNITKGEKGTPRKSTRNC